MLFLHELKPSVQETLLEPLVPVVECYKRPGGRSDVTCGGLLPTPTRPHFVSDAGYERADNLRNTKAWRLSRLFHVAVIPRPLIIGAPHAREQPTCRMLSLRTLAAVAFTAYAAVAHAALVPTSYTPSGKPIYEAPPDSRVVQDDAGMLVFAPNGTLLHVFDQRRPLATRGPDPLMRPRQTQPEVDVNVDQISAPLSATGTLLSFNATFVVPPLPTTFHSQFMYLSLGITTLDEGGAPETFYGGGLQYGRNSPHDEPRYCAILNIMDFANGRLVPRLPDVTVGETLGFSIAYRRHEDIDMAEPSYYYDFKFFGSDKATRMGWMSVPQENVPRIASVGFRMEELGVSRPSVEYPAGPLVFKDINVELMTGFAEVQWERDGASGTGVEFDVVKGGSREAEIKLKFLGGANEVTEASVLESVAQYSFEV
ncbi:hypothetical protein HMN09_00280200 [Mycena chlorophos]|uniref:Uncharacterized protein n=1 Tax=Mycena chlorophos TaxID=658473 RepID=A0A8H6WP46_MYCCL|nr:hypothetical protein HMN09_00280200 [Mycena chlorophos]